jgi:hypothetical protein
MRALPPSAQASRGRSAFGKKVARSGSRRAAGGGKTVPVGFLRICKAMSTSGWHGRRTDGGEALRVAVLWARGSVCAVWQAGFSSPAPKRRVANAQFATSGIGAGAPMPHPLALRSWRAARTRGRCMSSSVTLARGPRQATRAPPRVQPNPSFKPSPNGKAPGPRYSAGVLLLQRGPGALPLVPV